MDNRIKDKSHRAIWVFGGANIDVIGTSMNNLIEHDSNIGNINLSFGGVGRNIAQTCSLHGAKTYFVSCFSHDYYGKLLKEDCESLGLDCSYSIISDNYPTSMYLALFEPNREMKVAMSDMRILQEMDIPTIEKALKKAADEDIIVVDSNMDENKLEFVMNHLSSKEKNIIASDPVSVNKIRKLESYLSHVSIFKPNKIEAEALTGIEIKDEKTAIENLNWFLERGTKEIIITMAHKGVLLGISKDKLYWFKHRDINMDSANGGGDSFMGAYLSERLIDTPPREAVRIAISTAITTIETEISKRREIDRNMVLANLEHANIIEEEL